jgi:hypothetical protein
MANETLNLGNIYPDSNEINQGENQEITLQFGDFRLVIIEDADEAVHSVISLDADTRMGQDISSDTSATRSAAAVNESSPSVQPNDIPIYSTSELLLILQAVFKNVGRKKTEGGAFTASEARDASAISRFDNYKA